MQTLKFLAILARKFLRARAEDIKNEVDHKVITAAIDQGVWHDDYGVVAPISSAMNITSFSATPNFNIGVEKQNEQSDKKKIRHLELS